jgi:hypothetical protein
MKKISLYGLLLLLISCGSNNPETKQPGYADTSTGSTTVTSKPISVTTNKDAGDHTLWMGLFAKWKKTENETIDGKYDTSNHIFIACKSSKGFPVDADQVTLLPASTCDQVQGTEVAVLERLPVNTGSASFVKVPSVITLTDTNRMHAKATIMIDNKVRPVTLDEESIKRLNNTKKVLNNVHFKNN